METAEAKSAIKALLLQSASLAGLEVGPMCPEELTARVQGGFRRISKKRRPEAAANLLRLVAAMLDSAQARGDKQLHEDNVREGSDKVCPVYPFR